MSDHIPTFYPPQRWTADRLKDLEVIKCDLEPKYNVQLKHRFKFYGLVMVMDGTGFFQLDDGPRVDIGPGTLINLYPGPVFQYGPHRGQNWTEYHACFVGDRVERWKEIGWFKFMDRTRMISDPKLLLPWYEQINEMFYTTRPGDRDRAALLTERLILEAFYAARNKAARHVDPILKDLVEYLKLHHEDSIDLESLADEQGVSYSYMRQGIKRMTGRSPYRLLLEFRVEAAQRLLVTTDLSISEIAVQVGIDDPFNFSRTFKRMVGSSPRDYRERMRPSGWEPRGFFDPEQSVADT